MAFIRATKACSLPARPTAIVSAASFALGTSSASITTSPESRRPGWSSTVPAMPVTSGGTTNERPKTPARIARYAVISFVRLATGRSVRAARAASTWPSASSTIR